MSESEALIFAKNFLKTDVLSNDIKTRFESEDELNEIREAENIDKKMRAAALNPDTNDYDVLIDTSILVLREGKRLPEYLASFIADVLEGKVNRPVKRGPDKYKNWIKNYKYFRCVKEVSERYEMPAYTNSELFKKETAAHVVSRAANCSLNTVIKAYQSMKNRG